MRDQPGPGRPEDGKPTPEAPAPERGDPVDDGHPAGGFRLREFWPETPPPVVGDHPLVRVTDRRLGTPVPQGTRAIDPNAEGGLPPPRRVKVVLADRRGARRVLRTLSDVEEQTSIGEKLVRDLVRAQLRTSLLTAAAVFGLLAVLPTAFFLLPPATDEIVLGYQLPWLILVGVPFPLMIIAGRWYHRQAGRHERDFVNMVEN